MRIDLHTHSSVSDGTEPPAVVMEQAAAVGLDVIALTDHDTAAGWAEASAAAKRLGIGFAPGIEFSARRGTVSVHMLGYLVDPDHSGLAEALTRQRDYRVGRAKRIVDALQPHTGITWADVEAASKPGAVIGRPHIADALVARGVVSSCEEAFNTILHYRSPGVISHHAPDPVEVIGLIRAAGGVPVIAHPAADSREGRLTEGDIEELAIAGLAGLEVDHRDNSAESQIWLRSLAARLGLIMTGSSDYHGSGKPNRLGENLTSEVALVAILAQGTGSQAQL